ncbi:ATP-binding protein [Patescibacteria group bacterium]|nr:ATP-binding protein [Patescibacteria group bacterium]MCG2701207.1 ATP-binding protein [Candidatus Parcubacteria bacterium]
MYITRIAENNLKNALNKPKIVIILGARQVGKTTLVKHFLSNQKTVFLNLDIEIEKQRLIAAASLSPADGLKTFGNPDILIIDEAQRIAETGRIIKGWYDANLPVKFILLGSSSLNLLNQVSESLTGRNEKIFLPPLLFKEILTFQSWYSSAFSSEQLWQNFSAPIKEMLLQSLIFGNYPDAAATADKQKFLLNLMADYLLKDVLQIGLIKTPELIKRLLMLLAHQIGSEVSVNELANNLNMSRITIERYLELLEQTFVIFRLPAFSSNPRKEIVKSQKIYFWDTGVRNALLNEFSLNPLRSDIGALWENWIISELAKINLLNDQRRNFYFWRSRAGSEVDLIIKENEKLSAYETKWQKKSLSSKTAFTSLYKTEIELINSDNFLKFLN